MRKVKEDFLYHYTSQESLFNIVKNGEIWGSNAYYMNDSNELNCAFDIFSKIVSDTLKSSSNKQLQKMLKETIEWLDYIRLAPFNIFCLSLSENGNLLSQWRAYTPYGSGVSIGFKRSDMQNFANKNGMLLSKCCYVKKEQKKSMKSVFNKILSDFNSEFLSKNKLNSSNLYIFLERYKYLLIKEAVKIKDSTFSEECEWRLIYINEESVDGCIRNQYRPGKSTLIPYVAFELKYFREDNYYFDHVYVGPSPNIVLSSYAISAYLFNSRACPRTKHPPNPYREL